MIAYVYRNLNAKTGEGQWRYGPKPKQPLKDENGKILNHFDVFIANVAFKESAATWSRCLANKLNPNVRSGWEVHAFAYGEIVQSVPSGLPRIAITYDKNNTGRFIRKDTGLPIVACEFVHFSADGHSYAIGKIS